MSIFYAQSERLSEMILTKSFNGTIFLKAQTVVILAKIRPFDMETEGLLLCSQGPVSRLYYGPDES
jgi:hypothetical protein